MKKPECLETKRRPRIHLQASPFWPGMHTLSFSFSSPLPPITLKPISSFTLSNSHPSPTLNSYDNSEVHNHQPPPPPPKGAEERKGWEEKEHANDESLIANIREVLLWGYFKVWNMCTLFWSVVTHSNPNFIDLHWSPQIMTSGKNCSSC